MCDEHPDRVSRVRGTQYLLKLFTGDRCIVGECLVEEDDNGCEDGEEETKSEDDDKPGRSWEGGVAVEIRFLP